MAVTVCESLRNLPSVRTGLHYREGLPKTGYGEPSAGVFKIRVMEDGAGVFVIFLPVKEADSGCGLALSMSSLATTLLPSTVNVPALCSNGAAQELVLGRTPSWFLVMEPAGPAFSTRVNVASAAGYRPRSPMVRENVDPSECPGIGPASKKCSSVSSPTLSSILILFPPQYMPLPFHLLTVTVSTSLTSPSSFESCISLSLRVSLDYCCSSKALQPR